jgi:hypothetical protein
VSPKGDSLLALEIAPVLPFEGKTEQQNVSYGNFPLEIAGSYSHADTHRIRVVLVVTFVPD